MKHLIKGAYDLHVHSAPDVLPRKINDIQMARRVVEAEMAGFAIKSHYFCTAERASLVNDIVPDCKTIGAITLNSSVGGVNPVAVDMAARAGTKIVWFPTTDSAYERKEVLSRKPGSKLPYWATILTELKSSGIEIPTINILDENGKLKDEVYEVIDILAKNEMILATSHLSHEETFKLVKEASKRKVERIIITHVDFPTTFYTIEEQKELAKYGAYMEHCYTTYATGKVDFQVTLEQIKAVGPDRVVIATDLGQKTAIYPDEGFLEFATELYKNGFTEEEVRKMTVHNSASLVE